MFNRRKFLHSASLLPVAAATSSTAFAQAKPNSRFEAPAPCLVGLNAYSFAKQLNSAARQAGGGRKGLGVKSKRSGTGGGKAARSGKGKAGGSRQGEGSGNDKGVEGGKRKSGGSGVDTMTLPGLLEYCVDPVHKFDAVDITGYYFPNDSATEATVPPDIFVDDIKNRASDLGLAICGTGIGNSLTGVPFDREGKAGVVFSTDEGGDRAAIANEVQRIKAWIEVAARLGAPVLRVFTGLEPSYLMKEHIKSNDPQKDEKAKRLQAWRAETFKRMVQGYLPIETVAAGKTGPVDPRKDVPALLEKLRAAVKETA